MFVKGVTGKAANMTRVQILLLNNRMMMLDTNPLKKSESGTRKDIREDSATSFFFLSAATALRPPVTLLVSFGQMPLHV
jgi:hypothetical protein